MFSTLSFSMSMFMQSLIFKGQAVIMIQGSSSHSDSKVQFKGKAVILIQGSSSHWFKYQAVSLIHWSSSHSRLRIKQLSWFKGKAVILD